ncbi:extracellular substrate binding-like orphan protein GrrP [Planktothrix agardhii]|uniref:extracellular substrate binding-like orphan protein GrrP n=1 Tax=Planktothrix agardhii TaxID=1160 RepID=UPI0020A79956|nr:extracellular substrate binding-like orphan protein GrrP [Planktothrix agardhii]CAD5952906.1 Glutamate/aspartate import solute-binding protein [Planktothrix agardhii]
MILSKKIAIAALGAVFSLSLSSAAFAETVMEKVARTGVLTAGIQTDFIPLSYVNDQEELVGYSIDILNQIKAQLAKDLGREITLELVPITIGDRIPKVLSRDVDIVCEDVTFTWNRDRYVDFSVSYGVTGTRLLVKKGSNLGTPESLVNRQIGVLENGSSESTIQVVQPQAKIVKFKTIGEGIAALEQGKIDAFGSDGVLLEGARQTLPNRDALEVVPNLPYAREGIACIVPENNSAFLDRVNFAIVKLMQGYVMGDKESVAIVDQWFGKDGVITIDNDLIKNYFQGVINSREQIKLN